MYLLSLFLELLDGTLVNTSALVDQMASCCGLARVHVANDDDVYVSFLLTHVCLISLLNAARYKYSCMTNYHANTMCLPRVRVQPQN